MWPYDGKRERKSHTGMRHYYYKCGNCKRNGSTVCALKLVRKSLRNVFLKPRQNGLSAQKIPERTQAAWKPKNTVSCSSRCFWVLLLFLTALFWNHQNFSGNNIRQNSTQNIEQKGHAATSLRLQFEKAACPEYHFGEKIVNIQRHRNPSISDKPCCFFVDRNLVLLLFRISE